MPLPAALAARLAKRGIIQEEEIRKDEEVEEVFAEDYDSDDEPVNNVKQHEPHVPVAEPVPQEEEEKEDDAIIFEKLACPNRVNTFHSCSDFCKARWGKKTFMHDRSCDKKRERLLRKYPLPEGWQEVGDPDTGRFYYWNLVTDQVSWLPPQHPRAKIVFGEVDLKSKMEAIAAVQRMPPRQIERKIVQEEEEEEEDDIDDLDDLEDPELLLERELEKRAASGRQERERERDREKRRGTGRGGRGRHRDRDRDLDELDPMDPASYSDIPRGTWSAGLEIQGSAKTGADVTASGPLFQQRPYPNPGAVLRANKEAANK